MEWMLVGAPGTWAFELRPGTWPWLKSVVRFRVPCADTSRAGMVFWSDAS